MASLPSGRLSAEHDVEADGEAGEVARAAAAAQEHDLVELQPQPLDQRLGLGTASAAPAARSRLQVRQHVLGRSGPAKSCWRWIPSAAGRRGTRRPVRLPEVSWQATWPRGCRSRRSAPTPGAGRASPVAQACRTPDRHSANQDLGGVNAIAHGVVEVPVGRRSAPRSGGELPGPAPQVRRRPMPAIPRRPAGCDPVRGRSGSG